MERGMTGSRVVGYVYSIIAVLFFALSVFLIGAFGWALRSRSLFQ